MTDQVQDKKAEIGINLSVLIQSLLLASTIGFGTSIVTSIKELSHKVSLLTTNTTLNASNINHNTYAIQRLRNDFDRYVGSDKKDK